MTKPRRVSIWGGGQRVYQSMLKFFQPFTPWRWRDARKVYKTPAARGCLGRWVAESINGAEIKFALWGWFVFGQSSCRSSSPGPRSEPACGGLGDGFCSPASGGVKAWESLCLVRCFLGFPAAAGKPLGLFGFANKISWKQKWETPRDLAKAATGIR